MKNETLLNEQRPVRKTKVSGLAPVSGLDREFGSYDENDEVWGELYREIEASADNDIFATEKEKEQVAQLSIAHAIATESTPEEYKEEMLDSDSKMNKFQGEGNTVAGWNRRLKSALAANDDFPAEDGPQVDVSPPKDLPDSASDLEDPKEISVQRDILDPLSKMYPQVYDKYDALMKLVGNKVVDLKDGEITSAQFSSIISQIATNKSDKSDVEKLTNLAKDKTIVAEQILKSYIDIVLEKILSERFGNN